MDAVGRVKAFWVLIFWCAQDCNSARHCIALHWHRGGERNGCGLLNNSSIRLFWWQDFWELSRFELVGRSSKWGNQEIGALFLVFLAPLGPCQPGARVQLGSGAGTHSHREPQPFRGRTHHRNTGVRLSLWDYKLSLIYYIYARN